MGKRERSAVRLRRTVDALPRRTKEAMLHGIATNRIIAGAYTDPHSGGICPMLAAHRNGGRTSVASFARAWDAYTGAKRPRRATRREVQALRAMLEASLAAEAELPMESIADVAAEIRSERERRARYAAAPVAAVPRRVTGERNRGPELRTKAGWAWLRPARRLDEYKDLLAAAEAQLAEQRAAELLGDGVRTGDRASASHTN